jgi:hypothetical protein
MREGVSLIARKIPASSRSTFPAFRIISQLTIIGISINTLLISSALAMPLISQKPKNNWKAQIRSFLPKGI